MTKDLEGLLSVADAVNYVADQAAGDLTRHVSLLLSPLDALAERVGLARASELLCVALTHSSYAAEHECESNERLEFLGDAVVDLAVADLIVTAYRS